MAQRFISSFCTAFLVTASALAFASCGIEAAEQPQSKTPAEQIAERFSGRTDQTPAQTEDQKAAAAAKAAESKRIAAAKREEKSRKTAAEEAAAKAEAEKVAAQLKADEEEMLALAKAEADQRRATLEAERQDREKSDEKRIAEDKAAEEVKASAIAEAEARKRSDEARAVEERRIAEEKAIAEAKAKIIAEAEARQRAEAEAKAKAKAKIAADAEAQEKLRAAELQRVAEREQAEQESRAAELKVLQARRQEESRQLAERLAAAEAARQAKIAATQSEISTSQQPLSASMPLAAVAGAKPTPITRATILIVMDAGSTGIRRFEKVADPVLCTRNGCYISAGAGAPAKFVAMAKALGPSGTLGERAGACKHSLTCVFRDVDLTASLGYLQPVDMKIMRHDRRESHVVTADSECRLDRDRLACRRPIVASGYRMWVLQEGLAALAGPDALQTALRDGLPPLKGQSAGLDQ